MVDQLWVLIAYARRRRREKEEKKKHKTRSLQAVVSQ